MEEEEVGQSIAALRHSFRELIDLEMRAKEQKEEKLAAENKLFKEECKVMESRMRNMSNGQEFAERELELRKEVHRAEIGILRDSEANLKDSTTVLQRDYSQLLAHFTNLKVSPF